MRSAFIQNNKYYLLPLTLFFVIGLIFIVNFQNGEELIFFSERRHIIPNYFFWLVNFLGEAYFYILACVILIFLKQFKNSIFVALTGITTLLSSQLLKYYFDKPRPLIYFSELIKEPYHLKPVPGVEIVSSYTSSFPSGHTMSAFALYGILSFIIDKPSFVKPIFLSFAVFAGIARIYLGQHFLEDVLAGALFGTVLAMLIYWIKIRFLGNKKTVGSI